jgi:hypothetical protein
MVPRIILVTLLLAQLADAASFAVGSALHGIGLESNGFAVAVFASSGTGGVLATKGAVIVAVIGLLAATATRFPRLLVWGGAVATSIGLLGFLANVTSLLILAG